MTWQPPLGRRRSPTPCLPPHLWQEEARRAGAVSPAACTACCGAMEEEPSAEGLAELSEGASDSCFASRDSLDSCQTR